MESQRDVSKGKQRISPPAAPAQREFLFVDAAKAKSSRQGRRNARSFVMQKARRERPWSTSKHTVKQRKSPETPSPTTISTPDLSTTPITATPSPPIAYAGTEFFPITDANSFPGIKSEICSDCQIFLCRPGQNLCPRCVQLQPSIRTAEDLDNSLFDPFGTSSIETNGRVSELIEHFVNNMAPDAIALDIRNKSDLMSSHWFGTAVADAGFMHSLLCTAALHQYMWGRGSVETILHHRAHAITAINSAITNPDPNIGIADANIGAVFNLLTVEEALRFPIFDRERSGDDQPNQMEIHLNGLRRMVQLRGGLKAINSNRILQAFILWHSTAHAIASFEAPYLSPSDLNSAAFTPRHLNGHRPNELQHLLECCKIAQVENSLASLVDSALILIADLNVWFGDPDSTLDPLDIQNFSCVLECTLLQWLRENEQSISPLEDALCVALLIFTVRTTEALKRRSDTHTLHYAASKRLAKALSATDRSEWQSCPDLLLWILAIGAISADGSNESSWFVYQASLACSEFSIFNADILLERLHLCGWVSFKLDEAVRHLYESIINLRLERCFSEFAMAGMAGPLQVRVASPDFSDWQNIDWSTLDPLMGNASMSPRLPGSVLTPSMGGNEGLYDFGPGFTFPHASPFNMR